MLKPCIIYMIDDDQEDQMFFSLALQRVDTRLECVFSNSCIYAMEKLTAEPDFIPDFIFIDVNMPMMNGIECLTELKKIERLSAVPIYMYSTCCKGLENCLKIGATGIIQKIPSIISLKEELCKILSEHKVSLPPSHH